MVLVRSGGDRIKVDLGGSDEADYPLIITGPPDSKKLNFSYRLQTFSGESFLSFTFIGNPAQASAQSLGPLRGFVLLTILGGIIYASSHHVWAPFLHLISLLLGLETSPFATPLVFVFGGLSTAGQLKN